MQYIAYGDPCKLREAEVAIPHPGAWQLLVRVVASSVNPIDWKLYNGSLRFFMPARFPAIPGFDIAGEVVKTGNKVSRFKPGDRIYACLDNNSGGAAAEYAVVGEQAVALMPTNLGFKEAAVVPLAGLTALQALRDRGELQEGERLLVVGASGGVGHFAVQIGKALDAHVTGVCSTKNVSMVYTLGADQVIDYERQADFVTDKGYDVLLDAVGTRPFRRFLEVMNPHAVYITLLPGPCALLGSALMPLLTGKRVVPLLMKPSGEGLQFLAKLIEAGRLHPVIDSTFTLAELPEAHRRSQRGHTCGKISIVINSALA